VRGVFELDYFFFLIGAFTVFVVSPNKEGPALPNELEPKEVKSDINAATPATWIEVPNSAVRTPAASVPTKASKVCTKVFTALSAAAFKKAGSNMCLFSFFGISFIFHIKRCCVKEFFARGERKRLGFEYFNKQEVEKSGVLWGKMD
jgi:hypothetical protein